MRKRIHLEIKKPSKVAMTISFAATLCALFYHIGIFFVFLFMKVYPMFIYNIFSIAIFTALLLLIPHRRSLISLFTIAVTEVVLHQVLAEYFIGSESSFHFFIFVMGLLPYLVFDYRFKVSVPITAITSALFLFLEVYNFPGVYEISARASNILRMLNITMSILMIVITILLFTMLVAKSGKELTNQNLLLEGEIKRASIIQQAFFRQNIEGLDGWSVSFYNKPMAGVSGDFFDFYRTDDKLDGFGLFDVSGHGISSGLITMLVKNIIHQEFYNNKNLELWEILNKINDRIIEEKGDVENYLTGILVRFTENQAEMVIAGHPAPLIFRKASATCDFVQKTANSTGAIGISGFPVFYVSQFVDFDAGDRLFFFSDGLLDAENDKKEQFGKWRLHKSFAESEDLSVEAQVDFIEASISNFRGNSLQNDDISMICIGRSAASRENI